MTPGFPKAKSSRRTLMLGLIVVWLIVLAGGWYFMFKSPQVPERYATIGGEFTLTSSDGPVSLADFRGQVVAVFFGYTHCPDVCPAGLNNIASALNQLDQEELAQTHALFISVDPERDTPQLMAEYANYFHARIIGLSGSLKAVAAVAKSYGVFFVRQPEEESESADDYYVSHSRSLFIINRDGHIVDMIKHDADPVIIADRIRTWLP
jgi:protein SCO1/2